MPFVRPATVVEVAVEEVAVNPPGLDVIVYSVIAEPLEAGAAQLTVAWVLVPDALTSLGAPGRPGVIALDADEDAPVPNELVAVTVNV